MCVSQDEGCVNGFGFMLVDTDFLHSPLVVTGFVSSYRFCVIDFDATHVFCRRVFLRDLHMCCLCVSHMGDMGQSPTYRVTHYEVFSFRLGAQARSPN